MPAPERISPRGVTPPPELLTLGELTVHGRVREASNAVLYCTVAYEGHSAACVYKPVAGERPLWDFPDGTLAQREVASYELSEAMGWSLIPQTVLRDGPYGQGMCQLWVEPTADGAGDGEGGADADADRAEDGGRAEDADRVGDGGPVEDGERSENGHCSEAADRPGNGGRPRNGDLSDEVALGGAAGLLALIEGEEPGPGWKAIGFAEVGEGRTALLVHADDVRLRRLAVLDAVINNGDRKGGHLLPASDGHFYAIDHGVTFNADDKLRTLLWGWAGEPLPADALDALRRLSADLAVGGPLVARLAELITAVEIEALRGRVADLLRTGRHPVPSGEWPAIPWPPV
ncbi:SCO1664 family protein [Streptomyces sp. NPDC050610]|uniref:SCO1664 family protein n=1 Tax=Streptomyces sp. NPDC050610 TaxID=3157097 RepID=UPI003433F8BD